MTGVNPSEWIENHERRKADHAKTHSIPFMAAPIIPDFGLNIAGTSKYHKGVNDA